MSKRIKAAQGMRVHVFSGRQDEDWGFGTIEVVEKIDLTVGGVVVGSSSDYPSKIVLDDGRVTEGCECWWFPLEPGVEE